MSMLRRSRSIAGRANRVQELVSLLIVALLLVLVVAPMLTMVYGSFRTSPPGAVGEFTIDKYRTMLDGDFLRLLGNTLLVGAGGTAIAIVAGLVLGILITRTNMPFADALDNLVIVPAYVAPFIGAIAWTALLSPNTGYINYLLTAIGLGTLNIYSIPGMMWVTGIYFAPVAYLYLRPALLAFDNSLEEAARVFGAPGARRLWHVVLPLVKPAVLSSLLVVFVNAVGVFAIVAVLGAPSHTDVIATRLVQLTTVYPSDVNSAAVLGVLLALLTVGGLMVNRRMLLGQDFASTGSMGSKRGRMQLRGGKYVALAVCSVYLVLSLILPVGALVVGSLQPYVSPDFSAGWTLSNYSDIVEIPHAMSSIGNSVLLAVTASIAGALIAAFIALIVVRSRSRLGGWVDYLSSLPLAVPSSVFGLGMLWLWIAVPVSVYGTRWVLFICYVALFLPYAVRATVTAMEQIHRSLEDAGRMFGASWLGVVRRIVLPLLLPGMLSGGIIILYHAVRELDASLLLYTPSTEVMSVLMWGLHGEGDFVHLFALSVINVLIVFVLVGLASRVLKLMQHR